MLGLSIPAVAARGAWDPVPPLPLATITNIVLEGDSLTGAATVGVDSGSWAWQYLAVKPAAANAIVRAQGSRHSGDVSMLDDGSNTLFGHLTEDCTTHGGQVIWAGPFLTNDFDSGFHGAAGATRAMNIRARLAEYWTRVKAKECKFAFGFAPPLRTDGAYGAGTAEWNASRAAFVANFRDPVVWGQVCDYYLPAGEQPDFNAADNIGMIGADGVHPTGAGQTKLLEANRAALDTLFDAARAGSTRMYPAAWPTGATGLATAAQVTRRFVVSGMAHKGVALTGANALSATQGAQVRVNGGTWTAAATGWLYNGDTVELRVTTSATPNGDVTTDLTVGSETRTLTFRTAADVPATQIVGSGVVAGQINTGTTAHTAANIALNEPGVLVAFIGSGNGGASIAATAGGIAMTPAGSVRQLVGYGLRQSAFALEVTADGANGTLQTGTHSIVATFSAAANQAAIAWVFVRNADATPTAVQTTDRAMDANPQVSQSLTVPAKGILLASLLVFRGQSSGTYPASSVASGTPVAQGATAGPPYYQGEVLESVVGARMSSGAVAFTIGTGTGYGTDPISSLVLKAKGA